MPQQLFSCRLRKHHVFLFTSIILNFHKRQSVSEKCSLWLDVSTVASFSVQMLRPILMLWNTALYRSNGCVCVTMDGNPICCCFGYWFYVQWLNDVFLTSDPAAMGFIISPWSLLLMPSGSISFTDEYVTQQDLRAFTAPEVLEGASLDSVSDIEKVEPLQNPCSNRMFYSILSNPSCSVHLIIYFITLFYMFAVFTLLLVGVLLHSWHITTTLWSID